MDYHTANKLAIKKELMLMKRKYLQALMAWALGMSLFTVAEAQEIKKGGLSGRIISVAVEIPANSNTPVFTTPSSRFFILTQVCTRTGAGPIPLLIGSTFGVFILGDVSQTEGICRTFSPGIALPQNEALSFTTANTVSARGMITGVLSKK